MADFANSFFIIEQISDYKFYCEATVKKNVRERIHYYHK